MNLTPNIKTFCKSNGADLVGITDLAPFKNGWTVLPQNLLGPYTFAISIAKHVKDRPNVGALICGVCIKVCPFGKKSRL